MSRPQFRLRIPMYDSYEGLELLRQLAESLGLSQTATLRYLVREEAKRKGLLK